MIQYFGPRIRALRKKKGWSQGELAKRLNKKDTAISNYEKEWQMPTLKTVMDMAEVFDLSIDSLIYGEQAEVVSVKRLTPAQRGLVEALIQELTNPTRQGSEPSAQQIKLLAQLIKQMGL